MHRIRIFFAALLVMLAVPSLSYASTRALLVACSDFVSQPDLGSAISGNLHMIASALLGASPRPDVLAIEDGTIGTLDALSDAVADAFSASDEDDLSILYLCTHGVLSSADDRQMHLLLGNGEMESPISSQQLYDIISPIQGEKLLILDACFSGAMIGRGLPPPLHALEHPATPGEALSIAPSGKPLELFQSPLIADPSIHVLTSASGHESSWYFDSAKLSTGAVSYFASALASGLGLYGLPEADLDGDGSVTLEEMHHHLRVAVPSSSSQLLSTRANELPLPTAKRPLLSRPLTGFSFGASLLTTDDPTLDFSFTVAEETAVQYRLVEFDAGNWNWTEAQTFLDEGDTASSTLLPGRKTRSLTLQDVLPEDSGYLMLQIFSLQGEELILCTERLIAVQPAVRDAQPAILCAESFSPGASELNIGVHLPIPAEITVSVYNAEGRLVRRLTSAQMTRPTPGDITAIYWDGRDADGSFVPAGYYTIAAETRIGGTRRKATADVVVE